MNPTQRGPGAKLCAARFAHHAFICLDGEEGTLQAPGRWSHRFGAQCFMGRQLRSNHKGGCAWARMKQSEACLSTEWTKSNRRREESLRATGRVALGAVVKARRGLPGSAEAQAAACQVRQITCSKLGACGAAMSKVLRHRLRRVIGGRRHIECAASKAASVWMQERRTRQDGAESPREDLGTGYGSRLARRELRGSC